MIIRLFRQHVFVSTVLVISTLILLAALTVFSSRSEPQLQPHSHGSVEARVSILEKRILDLQSDKVVLEQDIIRLRILNTNNERGFYINHGILGQNTIMDSALYDMLAQGMSDIDMANQARNLSDLGHQMQDTAEAQMIQIDRQIEELETLLQ